MASLTKTKDGKHWCIRFYNAKKTPQRKAIYRPTKEHDERHGLTRLQADRLKRDLEDDYRNGWNPWKSETPESLRPSLSLKQAIQETLDDMEDRIAASTYTNRVHMYDTVMQEFGESVLVENLQQDILNQWINEAAKYSYRQRRKDVLNFLFKYMKKKYNLPKPEFEVVANRSEKNSYYNKDFKTFILREQLEFMLERINDVPRRNVASLFDRKLLADFYRLAYLTGRRRGELLAIKGEWISLKQPIIHLFDDDFGTKGNRFEFIMINNEAWALLKRLKKPGLIFDPFTKEFVTSEFKKLLRRTMPPEIAEKMSLHKLRDSAIMRMLYQEEMQIQHVMDAVGHDSFASLQKYRHRHGKMIIDTKREQWENHLKTRETSENGIRLAYDSKMKLVKRNAS
jgi:integrase